jgi:hypothetical protein
MGRLGINLEKRLAGESIKMTTTLGDVLTSLCITTKRLQKVIFLVVYGQVLKMAGLKTAEIV